MTTHPVSPLAPPGPPAPTPPPSRVSILKPPTPLTIRPPSVFLAGSIDMGSAPDWQAELTTFLSATPLVPASSPLTILNPRRGGEGAWSMEQSLENREFVAQVEWELDALDAADVVALYFAPASRAPISLLELGLYARSGRLVVCCPEGFWRKGNVQVVCRRHGIELFDGVEEWREAVAKKLAAVAGAAVAGGRALLANGEAEAEGDKGLPNGEGGGL